MSDEDIDFSLPGDEKIIRQRPPMRGSCHNCGGPIVYDLHSGYWIHAGYGKVDGANGLHCSPGMWDGTEERVYARPA